MKLINLFNLTANAPQNTGGGNSRVSLFLRAWHLNLIRLAALFTLLFTIGVGQMVAKTVYIELSAFPEFDNNDVMMVHYWGSGSGDNTAEQVVNHLLYKATVPDGATWCVFQKNTGGTWSGHYGNDCSSSQNFYYLTGWEKSGSAGSTVVKEYDGTEYIYWRTNPANYNAWGDDNATLQIRLIRLDGTNLGFVNASDKDATSDHVARYLVPAGTYLRPELHTTKNNAYTGTFEFSSTASDNFIYNFTNNGGWANWATSYFSRSAYVYFDNTNSQWTNTYKEIMVGRDGTSDTYNMTLIPNTNNLYCYTSGLTYNDFTQFCFIGNSSHWGQYNDSPNNRKGSANTNTANYQVNMDHSSRLYNLFIPAGTTKGTSLTHTAYGDYASLNYTQTVEQKLSENGGDSYSTSTRALATVSVNSYKMTSATGTTADGGSITSGQSSKSCDAARTATVTYSVSSVAEGYTFVGWYDGDTEKSTSTTYTYEATEAKTITARFKANSYTVVFNGNDKTSGSMSNQTFYYNVAQNLTTNAYSKNNYSFGGWTTNNDGTGSSYTNGQSVSNWSSTDGASITIYAKWTQSITLDRESGTSGSTSVTATYNSATLGSYDNPERSGYTFGGYYSGDNGTGQLIINTSKALQASKSVDEDVYTGTGGIWKHSSATTLYAKWTANNYTVTLENLGADEGHKGTENVSVTYDATTGLTSSITKPEKTHYDFGGYYTSEDGGETLGTQLIDANGNWKKSVSGYTGASGDYATWVYADNISLYAKWTEHQYAITTVVSPSGAGTISVGSSTTAKYVTPSGDITATANAGWIFKEWQFSKTDEDYDVYVSDGNTYHSTDATIRILAVHDGTLTAVFEPRYYLVGGEIMSGEDETGTGTSSGMPGWDNYTDPFNVITSSPVLATCSLTLGANKHFYIMVRDKADGLSYGKSDETLEDNESLIFADQDNRVLFHSNGGTAYTFKISAINGSGRPTVSVERPYQVNVGRKRVDIDGNDHDDNTGGTVDLSKQTAPETWTPISNGDWVPYGISVKYNASKEDGYTVDWYNASDYETWFSNADYWFHTATSTGNGYAKFTEKATTVTLANDGHGKVQISSTDKTSTTCGVTTTRSLTAVPNTGYSFSSWTKTSGDDITISSTSANPTTLTGRGSGASSGQTVTANFTAKTYTVTLNNDHGGEDSDDGSATATYDATSLSSITHAKFSGWTLLGYWNSSAVQVTDANGDLQANVDGYTDGSAKWTKDGDANLWAHWSRSVSLDREGGATGATSMTVTYKSSTLSSYSAPTKTGYNFAGYYTGDNGTGTMVINTSGVLQSNVTGYTNSSGGWTKADATTLYAKWTPVTLTFTGATDSDWDKTSNWSPACVPTIDHDVVLEAPVVVKIAHATAKSVVIYNNGDTKTGKLTIQPSKGLEVVGTIQKTTDGSSYSATGEEDLILESSSSEGNASLIFNNSNACQATVQMYSKGYIDGETWNWQYVGTPFTGSIPQYNYYGSWMYKWNNGSWAVVHGGDELTPFAGYCLTQESATTHVMGGTLVATDGNDQEITMAASTDMVLANSWTAPIYIDAFTTEGEGATFTSTPATIYLFNTGMAEKGSKAGTTAAGTYVALPVHSATSFGVEFIPSMQGFFVTTQPEGGSGKAGTITLKYDELVRPDNEGYRTSIITGQMYAPKRENKPEVMKIRVDGETYYDRVVILAREDFSNAFDNGWDGENINEPGNGPMIYALREDGTKDAVSAIPSFEGTVVGFHPGTDNSCTISFEYNGEDVWYLNDLKEQKSTLIDAAQTYTFTTSANDSEVRFIISATPIQKVATGVENGELLNGANGVRKVLINDHIYIIRSGRIYSVDGVLVK